MKTLAFDGRTGASGDMLLGALVAAGADSEVLSPIEDVLDVTYRIGETTKNGIRATTVDVLVDGDGHEHADHAHEHEHGHDHGDGHEHADHAHDHEHSHDHTHAEGHGPNRTYAECRDIVGEMGLPEAVEADATAVFRLLGEAESRVHGTDLEETHFHEVGADDAIADIVGAALLFDDLDADRVVTTPVAVGGGEASMSHGVYPVPTPAVTYIAEAASWELHGGPLDEELLTPTGAAILAHFAEGVDSLPPMDIDSGGYGAGSKSFEDHPNVLRAMVGNSSGGLKRDDIRVLETNLDDASPEMLGGLQETLTDAGARDVTVVPATMKKSRPGHLVKVIVKPDDVASVARRLAEETGTLGIRETAAGHRWIAGRSFETVELDIGDETFGVTVKIAADDAGEVYDVSAEYDDAAAVADATDLAIRDVVRRAETAYRQEYDTQ
ncbi:nickel pincer cofactor biosynthesis protein LarC [Natronomonas gomsonensis]|uniref:nickel pincer cofactor biosynthesis protein LarC n=1 Tax=Natronomonas gomsonensis TaxID=1046043 RepID=UPI0015BA4F07|nr:nickel pincer cofactor biosynthesis protein LarC [Natronomonas gomsonensis]